MSTPLFVSPQLLVLSQKTVQWTFAIITHHVLLATVTPAQLKALLALSDRLLKPSAVK